jgi:hypothetical protein|nr:MAG TPA: zinc-ribbon containing domain protein [Caudoviricetes sp.]
MAEYIEKNAAIAKLTRMEVTEPLSTMIDAKRMLADMPAADVAPVRRGQWNWVHRLKGGFEHYTGREANPGTEYPETYTIRRDERREVDDPYCPFCGKWNESVWLNFCPNCGADMREVLNDD